MIQQTLNVLASKMRDRMTPSDARRSLSTALIPLWDVMPSPELYVRALDLQERYGFHFYDSLIIAAALESGSTRLLSEDFQDGRVIESLTVENPFRA